MAPRIPPTRAPRSRTILTCGLVLSRNTSSIRMGVLSASRKTATPVLPGPVLLRRRLQIHGQPGSARSSKSIWISVLPPASIMKASTRKSPKASGNSRSSPKAPPKPLTTLWTARYLMMRLCEKYEVDFELHCKPIKGDWNGSGMHTNFSTKHLREVGGKEYFEALMKAFSEQHRRAHRCVWPG